MNEQLEQSLKEHDRLVKIFETKLAIIDNEAYKQVLKDSFGGVMYNVANRDKYNSSEVLQLWNSLTPQAQDSFDGITKGAMHFLEGK